LVALRTRCLHGATEMSLDVLKGSHDKKLQRRACGVCGGSWWERDGIVVQLPEVLGVIEGLARALPRAAPQKERRPIDGGSEKPRATCPSIPPDPVQATSPLVALVTWVGQAIGTDLVVFAAIGPLGWQITAGVEATRGGVRPTCAGDVQLGQSLLAEAFRHNGLLTTVAELHRPIELTTESLNAICPDLVAAGMGRVVGAPVYKPSGSLAAVIIAAYRAGREPDQLTVTEGAAWACRDTIACMGKLLATAHCHLRTVAASARGTKLALRGAGPDDPMVGEPDGLLRVRQVATIFAVTPRTILNWVRTGTLAATRTAGGHVRLQRRDVLALCAEMGMHHRAEGPPHLVRGTRSGDHPAADLSRPHTSLVGDNNR